MTMAFSKLRPRFRHSETLWPAIVLAASFVATQVVNIIEFIAVP